MSMQNLQMELQKVKTISEILRRKDTRETKYTYAKYYAFRDMNNRIRGNKIRYLL